MMPKSRRDTFLMVMPSPTIAPMPMNEPISIISGRMRCSAPWSWGVPTTVRRLEAMPEMLAPMRLSRWQSCWR